MSSKFKYHTIGLMGRIQSENSAKSLKEIMKFLDHHQLKYCMESETATLFSSVLCPVYHKNNFAGHCDVVVVVGGDGSILHAARAVIAKGIPVIGVNRGRLGYLTDIAPTEIEQRLYAMLQGEFISEKRFLLEAMIIDHDFKEISKDIALNDVVLLPGEYAQMIEFEIYINNQLVCHQRADGQIIATPTGSTAYALSGGGPILHPSLEAIVLVPMFSHTLSARPIVVDSQSEIEFRIAKGNKTSPYVSCDGMDRVAIEPGAKLMIKRKQEALTLLHPKDYQYFETLREKLRWQNPL